MRPFNFFMHWAITLLAPSDTKTENFLNTFETSNIIKHHQMDGGSKKKPASLCLGSSIADDAWLAMHVFTRMRLGCRSQCLSYRNKEQIKKSQASCGERQLGVLRKVTPPSIVIAGARLVRCWPLIRG